jgi:hypothetical protein
MVSMPFVRTTPAETAASDRCDVLSVCDGFLVFACDKVLSILNLCSAKWLFKVECDSVFKVILAVLAVAPRHSGHHLFSVVCFRVSILFHPLVYANLQ